MKSEFVDIPYPEGAFQIGITPVTQAEWEEIMGNNPSQFKGKNNPIESVSWNDCQEFIKKLNGSQKEYIYRLPDENEWEFAAGRDPINIMDYAWCHENSGMTIHPVKKKNPNEYGLYDMLGNVWEWTNSFYYNLYRVIRGGSWVNDARNLRAAGRDAARPDYRNGNVGFRLVRTSSLDPITLLHSNETYKTVVESILKKIDDLKIEMEKLK